MTLSVCLSYSRKILALNGLLTEFSEVTSAPLTALGSTDFRSYVAYLKLSMQITVQVFASSSQVDTLSVYALCSLVTLTLNLRTKTVLLLFRTMNVL